MGSVQITVGEFEIFVIDDHIGLQRDPADVFVNVSSAEWEPHREYALNEYGKWESQWRGHLIRRADGIGDTVLVDTGMGTGPYDHGPASGELLRNLAEIKPSIESLSGSVRSGLGVSGIDNVVITHCHGDHIGWNLSDADNGGYSPTFPYATYYVAARDWEYYSKPENANDAFDQQVSPLRDHGVLRLVNGTLEIVDGITIVPTNGHTPGHQCVLVRSRGETAVITGDLFHNVAQIVEQHWCPVFDWRTDLSIASRRWLLWRAMVEEWIVASGHLPTGMSIGKIAEIDGKPTWQPQ